MYQRVTNIADERLPAFVDLKKNKKNVWKNWDIKMARKNKIAVKTDNSNWQAPKVRKKRKPMSEEQLLQLQHV